MNQTSNSTKRLYVGLAVGVIFGLGVGLVVGLVFAYQIAPLEWTNAGPSDLRVDYAAYYWELVAESYADHGNLDLAKRQLGEWKDQQKLEDTLERAYLESSPELQLVLDSLSTRIAPSVDADETPAPAETPAEGPSGQEDQPATGSLLPSLAIVFLVILAVVVIALFIVRMRKKRQEAPPAAPEVSEEPPEWLATLRPEEDETSLPSLGHFVTSYSLGNDTYDESFSIETAAGEFLGECGVGISETIGAGDPDKVTAFEVWLFDKNDIRTVTQVLMSEHAFNDPDLRASLASKGEAILAQLEQPMMLETATLRLDVLVTEMSYGSDALPPNSFFDRLTVELVARGKQEQAPEDDGVL